MPGSPRSETKDHVPGTVLSTCRTDWTPRLLRETLGPSSFAVLGKDAWVAGVPAVDDFLTDAGYFLMTLGHQSRYDLF